MNLPVVMVGVTAAVLVKGILFLGVSNEHEVLMERYSINRTVYND